MTIKADVDALIDRFPSVPVVHVDCSKAGGRRLFKGDKYRDRLLIFVGESRATKKRKEAEREKSFKEAQGDAFQ